MRLREGLALVQHGAQGDPFACRRRQSSPHRPAGPSRCRSWEAVDAPSWSGCWRPTRRSKSKRLERLTAATDLRSPRRVWAIVSTKAKNGGNPQKYLTRCNGDPVRHRNVALRARRYGIDGADLCAVGVLAGRAPHQFDCFAPPRVDVRCCAGARAYSKVRTGRDGVIYCAGFLCRQPNRSSSALIARLAHGQEAWCSEIGTWTDGRAADSGCLLNR